MCLQISQANKSTITLFYFNLQTIKIVYNFAMFSKLAIDAEIEQIKQALQDLEDTHPDYTPPELKELQSRVLAVHAHIENALETRILLQIKKSLPSVRDEEWY